MTLVKPHRFLKPVRFNKGEKYCEMGAEKNIQLLYPGGYFHVYNRGNNKEIIFRAPENYMYFLSLWKKYIEPVAQTFCYNLLPNHFHFFIRVREQISSPGEAPVGELIRTAEAIGIIRPETVTRHFSNMFNAYAKAINKKYNRTGSLFQERFRRKEITDCAYYTSLIGYIVSNAVKHGLVKRAVDYSFGSYQALISEKPSLLLRDEVLEWYGGRSNFIDYINKYEQTTKNADVFFESEWDD